MARAANSFPEPVGPRNRIGRLLFAARFSNGLIGLRAEFNVMAVMAFSSWMAPSNNYAVTDLVLNEPCKLSEVTQSDRDVAIRHIMQQVEAGTMAE